MAFIEYLNDDWNKKLKSQIDENTQQKHEYETKIDELNKQISDLQANIESQKDSLKSDLDIALRSIQTDMSMKYDRAINEKEEYIKQLESELEQSKLANQTLNDFEEKERSYVEKIDNLEKLRNDLVKSYNQEIAQLKLLSQLNNEAGGANTTVNDMSICNVTSDVDDDGGASNIDDLSLNNIPTIIATLSSSRLKEANDEILAELKLTLEEKEKFIKQLQEQIEEYKADYDNMKNKYENSLIEIKNLNKKPSSSNENNNNSNNDDSVASNEDAELEAGGFGEVNYKQKYFHLKEEIESFRHPLFIAWKEQLDEEYSKAIDDIKAKHMKEQQQIVKQLMNDYEEKLKLLSENNQKEHQEELKRIELEHRDNLNELEAKHKNYIDILKAEFKSTLDEDINKLKAEFEQANPNKSVDIKYHFISEHRTKEMHQTDELYEQNPTEDNKSQEQQQREQSPPTSTLLTETPVKKETVASTAAAAPGTASSESIEELKAKLEELDKKNKKLTEEMEKIYEKDDVFMASTRRQNEEHENFIKLLQSDILGLTNERNTLLQNNHHLFNILSKTMWSSTSIEDHINKRLAKIIQTQQQANMAAAAAAAGPSGSKATTSRQASRVTSPKNQNDMDNRDDDSTGGEDLSDEGLDISQRLCDSLLQSNFDSASEEAIIECLKQTNNRIQTSIDKLLNMLEDSSKQLNDSYVLQKQLADKFEESKQKLSSVQAEHEEKINDLVSKLSYFQGLAEGYEKEVQKSKGEVEQLEQRLEEYTKELDQAHEDLDQEKTELRSLEVARKDLLAQRDLFVNELDDTNLKELIRNNSELMEEKQELTYKLNKTVDETDKQIRNLENSVDELQLELRTEKEKHVADVNELKKQIEAMEMQIKNEKTFLENQLSEFEQEKDDYEARIKDLTEYINRKESMKEDNEESAINKNKEYERLLQERTDRLNQLLVDNNELERLINDKEQSISNLNEIIHDLEQQLDKETKTIEDSEKKYKSEIDLIMQRLKKANEMIDEYKEKEDSTEINVQNYKEDIERLEKEKEEMLLENNELQVQLHNQRSKVAELELHNKDIESSFKLRIDDLESKVKSSQLTILDKDAQIQKQRQEIIDLKEELQDKIDIELHQQSQLMTADYKSEINRLKEENTNLNNEIDSIKDELKRTMSTNNLNEQLVENKNEEIDDLLIQIKELQERLKESVESLNEVNQKYTELVESREKFEDDCKANMDAIEEQVRTLREENERNLIALESAATEKEFYENELKSKENELKTIENELDKHTNEEAKFEANIDNLKQIINEQESKLENERERYNQLEQTCKEYETNFNLTSDKLTEKEFEINLLKTTINELNIEINELKMRNLDLQDTQIKQVHEIKEANKEEFEEQLAKIENDLKENMSLNTQLKENLEEKLEKIRALETSKQTDEVKLREHETNMVKLNDEIKQHVVTINDKDTKLKQLNQNYDTLRLQLNDLQKEHSDLEDSYNTYKQKVEKQVSEYQYEIKRLLNENDENKKAHNLQINETQTNLKKQIHELEEKHKKELTKLTSEIKMANRNDVDVEKLKQEHHNEIERIKEEHKNEIEKLKREYEKTIKEKAEQVRREALSEADRRIDELRQQYERELTLELDRSSSPDSTISYDLGKKLREQVRKTQELDSRLIGSLKQPSANKLNDSFNSQISNKIKQILEKVESEGVLLLTLSELLQLKTHLNQKAISTSANQNMTNKMLSAAFESEKEHLNNQIFQLRDLLAKLSDPNSSTNSKDWRGDLIRAVANIFKEEQEAALAELRSYISSNGHLDENKVAYFESKLKAQEQLHEKALNTLMALDRQTLLNELRQLKEDNQKLIEDMKRIQEGERQFKRELQLMEYNKDTENIKANDLKQTLNTEKSKNLELMDKLVQERKKANTLQEQLCDVKDEISRIKEHLSSETKNYKLLCRELDAEKAQNLELKKYNEHLKNKLKELEEDGIRTSKRGHMSENQEITQLRRANNELEQRFIELQRHANELEHLLVDEKAKHKDIDYDKRNLKSKFEQIQSNGIFQSDLERLRQALESLAVKHKSEVESSDTRHEAYSSSIKKNLNDIIDELRNLSFAYHTNSPISVGGNGMNADKLLRQNHDLVETIKKLNEEKINLHNTLVKLEEELWHYKRNQKNENIPLSEHDKEKFKKLYYKYLRAESFRKSLVYQKRFLLIMLSGYEDTEREILAALKVDPKIVLQQQQQQQSSSTSNTSLNSNNINDYIYTNGHTNGHGHHNGYRQTNTNTNLIHNTSYMNGYSSNNKNSSFYSNRFTLDRTKAKSRFRTGALCVIAIHRIKFLMKKHSNVLTRIDSGSKQLFS